MTTLGEGATAFDEAALDAFADRMIGVLNDACTNDQHRPSVRAVRHAGADVGTSGASARAAASPTPTTQGFTR